MTEKKEKKPTLEIKGGVAFKELDPHVARFELERHELFASNRTFDIPAGAFPGDFDHELYKVSGSHKIELFIEKK